MAAVRRFAETAPWAYTCEPFRCRALAGGRAILASVPQANPLPNVFAPCGMPG